MPRGRIRTVAGSVGVVLLAVACAYITMWLGGATEILWHDDPPSGRGCTVVVSVSTVVEGREDDRWFGGGFLGQPGTVCVLPHVDDSLTTDPSSTLEEYGARDGADTYRVFSRFEVIAAIFATLMFVVVVTIASEELDSRR